jgi:hypothetical protein
MSNFAYFIHFNLSSHRSSVAATVDCAGLGLPWGSSL